MLRFRLAPEGRMREQFKDSPIFGVNAGVVKPVRWRGASHAVAQLNENIAGLHPRGTDGLRSIQELRLLRFCCLTPSSYLYNKDNNKDL